MTDTVELAYEEQGSGPAIMLLHGFPLDHTIWADQMKALAEAGYRAVAPDLRGHGLTPAAGDSFSMEIMAADVDALRARLGVERIALAGHSMGGYVALAYARLYPGRLAALALVSTRAGADSEAARTTRVSDAQAVREQGTAFIADKMVPRLFAPGVAERVPELTGRVREIVLGTPPTGIAGALLGMSERGDSTPGLARITVPVAVIAGQDDQIIPPSESEAMAGLLPNAHLELIPLAGHMPMLEQPEAVSRALRELMARASPE